jgi:hypothetical protein
MPMTSVMWVMRREPSRRRAAWTPRRPTRHDDLAHGLGRQRETAHGDHRFHTAEAFARAVGVDRAHRAVMTGVHRLQQVEHFGAAHLADDDAFGTHTQAVLDQVAHGDLALALKVGRAGFEPDHMRLLQLEFGGVFAGDDALVFIDIGGQAVEQRRLTGTGTARKSPRCSEPGR